MNKKELLKRLETAERRISELGARLAGEECLAYSKAWKEKQKQTTTSAPFCNAAPYYYPGFSYPGFSYPLYPSYGYYATPGPAKGVDYQGVPLRTVVEMILNHLSLELTLETTQPSKTILEKKGERP